MQLIYCVNKYSQEDAGTSCSRDIYDVVLNEWDARARLAPTFREKAYPAPPETPAVHMNPATAIASGTISLKTGVEGGNGVAVDEHGRTRLPHILAIGDCAIHANAYAPSGSPPLRCHVVYPMPKAGECILFIV